ncbi:MAG: hypothetical protein JW871_01205 [Endomicrobiales bacterium]|nr:hypothetical protein [Endomicrobiales bacterium]
MSLKELRSELKAHPSLRNALSGVKLANSQLGKLVTGRTVTADDVMKVSPFRALRTRRQAEIVAAIVNQYISSTGQAAKDEEVQTVKAKEVQVDDEIIEQWEKAFNDLLESQEYRAIQEQDQARRIGGVYTVSEMMRMASRGTFDDVITEGYETDVYRRTSKDRPQGRLSFVMKIIHSRTGRTPFMAELFTTRGYMEARRLIPDLIADVAIGLRAKFSSKGRKHDFKHVIYQIEAEELPKALEKALQDGDSARAKDIVRQKARLDIEAMRRGGYLADGYMKQYGLIDGKVRLLDAGNFTSRPKESTPPLADMLYMPFTPLGEKQRFNKRGYVLYVTRMDLRKSGREHGLGDELADIYEQETGLTFSDEWEFIYKASIEQIEQYWSQLKPILVAHNLPTDIGFEYYKELYNVLEVIFDEQVDDRIKIVMLNKYPRELLSTALGIRNKATEFIMRNVYDNLYQQIAQEEYDKYYKKPVTTSVPEGFGDALSLQERAEDLDNQVALLRGYLGMGIDGIPEMRNVYMDLSKNDKRFKAWQTEFAKWERDVREKGESSVNLGLLMLDGTEIRVSMKRNMQIISDYLASNDDICQRLGLPDSRMAIMLNAIRRINLLISREPLVSQEELKHWVTTTLPDTWVKINVEDGDTYASFDHAAMYNLLLNLWKVSREMGMVDQNSYFNAKQSDDEIVIEYVCVCHLINDESGEQLSKINRALQSPYSNDYILREPMKNASGSVSYGFEWWLQNLHMYVSALGAAVVAEKWEKDGKKGIKFTIKMKNQIPDTAEEKDQADFLMKASTVKVIKWLIPLFWFWNAKKDLDDFYAGAKPSLRLRIAAKYIAPAFELFEILMIYMFGLENGIANDERLQKFLKGHDLRGSPEQYMKQMEAGMSQIQKALSQAYNETLKYTHLRFIRTLARLIIVTFIEHYRYNSQALEKHEALLIKTSSETRYTPKVIGESVGVLRIISDISDFEQLWAIKDNEIVAIEYYPTADPTYARPMGIITCDEPAGLSHAQGRARAWGIPHIVLNSQNLADLEKFKDKWVYIKVEKDNVELRLATDQEISDYESYKPKKPKPELAEVDLTTPKNVLEWSETRNPREASSKFANLHKLSTGLSVYNAEYSGDENASRVNWGPVLPYATFKRVLDANPGVETEIVNIVKTINNNDINDIITRLSRVRELILGMNIPDSIWDKPEVEVHGRIFGRHSIKNAIEDLTFRDNGVFVRVGTNGEDLDEYPGLGMGQYGTFSNVMDEDVKMAVKHVWASIWSVGAYLERQKMGLDHFDVYPAVQITEAVDADYSFVIYTADPDEHNTDTVVIEIAQGLGEGLVGDRYPGRAHRFVYSKSQDKIISYEQATKKEKAVLNPDGGLMRASAEYADDIFLIDREASELALTLARQAVAIEKVFNRPQDIEGAVKLNRSQEDEEQSYYISYFQSRAQVGYERFATSFEEFYKREYDWALEVISEMDKQLSVHRLFRVFEDKLDRIQELAGENVSWAVAEIENTFILLSRFGNQGLKAAGKLLFFGAGLHIQFISAFKNLPVELRASILSEAAYDFNSLNQDELSAFETNSGYSISRVIVSHSPEELEEIFKHIPADKLDLLLSEVNSFYSKEKDDWEIKDIKTSREEMEEIVSRIKENRSSTQLPEVALGVKRGRVLELFAEIIERIFKPIEELSVWLTAESNLQRISAQITDSVFGELKSAQREYVPLSLEQIREKYRRTSRSMYNKLLALEDSYNQFSDDYGLEIIPVEYIVTDDGKMADARVVVSADGNKIIQITEGAIRRTPIELISLIPKHEVDEYLALNVPDTSQYELMSVYLQISGLDITTERTSDNFHNLIRILNSRKISSEIFERISYFEYSTYLAFKHIYMGIIRDFEDEFTPEVEQKINELIRMLTRQFMINYLQGVRLDTNIVDIYWDFIAREDILKNGVSVTDSVAEFASYLQNALPQILKYHLVREIDDNLQLIDIAGRGVNAFGMIVNDNADRDSVGSPKVKLLKLCRHERFVDLFLKEMQILYKLNENKVAGAPELDEKSETGEYWGRAILMEYLEGDNLYGLSEEAGKITWEFFRELEAIGDQVAECGYFVSSHFLFNIIVRDGHPYFYDVEHFEEVTDTKAENREQIGKIKRQVIELWLTKYGMDRSSESHIFALISEVEDRMKNDSNLILSEAAKAVLLDIGEYNPAKNVPIKPELKYSQSPVLAALGSVAAQAPLLESFERNARSPQGIFAGVVQVIADKFRSEHDTPNAVISGIEIAGKTVSIKSLVKKVVKNTMDRCRFLRENFGVAQSPTVYFINDSGETDTVAQDRMNAIAGAGFNVIRFAGYAESSQVKDYLELKPNLVLNYEGAAKAFRVWAEVIPTQNGSAINLHIQNPEEVLGDIEDLDVDALLRLLAVEFWKNVHKNGGLVRQLKELGLPSRFQDGSLLMPDIVISSAGREGFDQDIPNISSPETSVDEIDRDTLLGNAHIIQGKDDIEEFKIDLCQIARQKSVESFARGTGLAVEVGLWQRGINTITDIAGLISKPSDGSVMERSGIVRIDNLVENGSLNLGWLDESQLGEMEEMGSEMAPKEAVVDKDKAMQSQISMLVKTAGKSGKKLVAGCNISSIEDLSNTDKITLIKTLGFDGVHFNINLEGRMDFSDFQDLFNLMDDKDFLVSISFGADIRNAEEIKNIIQSRYGSFVIEHLITDPDQIPEVAEGSNEALKLNFTELVVDKETETRIRNITLKAGKSGAVWLTLDNDFAEAESVARAQVAELQILNLITNIMGPRTPEEKKKEAYNLGYKFDHGIKVKELHEELFNEILGILEEESDEVSEGQKIAEILSKFDKEEFTVKTEKDIKRDRVVFDGIRRRVLSYKEIYEQAAVSDRAQIYAEFEQYLLGIIDKIRDLKIKESLKDLLDDSFDTALHQAITSAA